MTETPDPAVRIPEDEPFQVGGFAMVVMGLLLGFVAAAGIGMLVLMNNDPLGPEARRPESTTVAPVAGDPAAGGAVYASTCATCHGADGEGIEGLGPSLIDNEFVASLSDAELVAFIETGRPADHPDNVSGIPMPPRGGNPSLSAQDIADLAAYLRTLDG